MLSRAVVQQKAQIEERVPPKMTLKSSPLVWSLAFMAAFLALTKETATKETEVHPYSIFIQHPSDPGSMIFYHKDKGNLIRTLIVL